MREQWKPIPTWETLYEVSDYGNIRSLERVVTYTNHLGDICTRTFKPRVLDCTVNRRNRRTVRLYQSKDGKVVRNKWCSVYRLVWEAFVGPIPKKMTIDHKDEDSTNDRLSNLEMMSMADNLRKSHKMQPENRRGDKHPHAKLTEHVVRTVVRPRLAAGDTIASVARRTFMGESAIRSIRDGKTWVHVK